MFLIPSALALGFVITINNNKPVFVNEVSNFVSTQPSQASPKIEVSPTLIASHSCLEPAKSAKAAAVGVTHYRYPEVSSSNLTKIDGQLLERSTASAFLKMRNTAWSEQKLKLKVISGFRSIKEQASIVNNKRSKGMSDKAIYNASSEPGYSEHHTGMAMDVNSLEPSFGQTKEGKWLKANVARFGFEISFPESRPNGVSYEPWHIRKVNPMFCYASKLIK